jgi:hypothetical protein
MNSEKTNEDVVRKKLQSLDSSWGRESPKSPSPYEQSTKPNEGTFHPE